MAEEKNGKEIGIEPNEADAEQLVKKIKYPRAIPFIISNEFCERFNYYGMRTILVLYLTQKLLFSDDEATIIYHVFTTLVYFFCIFGAIIADSWWGKFQTILWLSMVYVAGSVIVALGAIESWNMPMSVFTFLGLSLIAIGSGGIKPCVAAFGGEQFKLPEQAKQIGIFFSLFYFTINAGSFISTSITPILREDVHCFGEDSCYSLGFGLPAVLMAVSVLIFLAGKFLYKIVPPQGNMLVKVYRCIANAISTKKKEKGSNPREHWLDYAETEHGKKLVLETKILLNILVLYLPLPFFWTLFDQQGSRWTFQATRMDGDIGFYTIKPDQMQVINPLLILTFIPLYEALFYPLLSLIGIRRPLQKLTLGGIFAGVAFVCSMLVEISIEGTYPILPIAGEAQVRMFNGLNCDYNLNTAMPTAVQNINLKPNSYFTEINVPVKGDGESFSFTLTSATENCRTVEGNFDLKPKTATSYFINGTEIQPDPRAYEDNPDKSRRGLPLIRILANTLSGQNVSLSNDKESVYNKHWYNTTLADVAAGTYVISVGDVKLTKKVDVKLGGVYTIIIQERSSGNFESELVTVTEPNTVSMLWLIPQYVIMTLGEVMYSVTGLTFSFTEAPESMKSVLQGCWMLTIAVGNLIVTIIVGAKFFERQTYEFALFAGLMFVDMAIFAWLAIRYKSIPLEELDKIDEEQKALEDSDKKKDPLDFPGTSGDSQKDD